MKLSIKAFALAAGILWAFALFITTGLNLIFPSYAREFLLLVASFYPGYNPGGVVSLFIGPLYGLIDAGIAAAVFAWIYNRLDSRTSPD